MERIMYENKRINRKLRFALQRTLLTASTAAVKAEYESTPPVQSELRIQQRYGVNRVTTFLIISRPILTALHCLSLISAIPRAGRHSDCPSAALCTLCAWEPLSQNPALRFLGLILSCFIFPPGWPGFLTGLLPGPCFDYTYTHVLLSTSFGLNTQL